MITDQDGKDKFFQNISLVLEINSSYILVVHPGESLREITFDPFTEISFIGFSFTSLMRSSLKGENLKN